MSLLDREGLLYFWQKIVSYVDSKIKSGGGSSDDEDKVTTIGYDASGQRQITEVSNSATTVTIFSDTSSAKVITATRTPVEGDEKHIKTTKIETINGEKVITETNTTVPK